MTLRFTKNFLSLFATLSLMEPTESQACRQGEIPEVNDQKKKKHTVRKSRTDSPANHSPPTEIRVIKPKKAKRDSLETKGNSNVVPVPEDLDQEELEQFLIQTEEIYKLKTTFEELTGDDFDDVIQRARDGDTKAHGMLGNICYISYRTSNFSLSISLDLDEFEDVGILAFKWLNSAFQRGDFTFSSELGSCHLLGIGTEKNLIEAMKCFTHPGNVNSDDYLSILSGNNDSDDPEKKFKVRLIAIGSGRLKYLEEGEKPNLRTCEFIEEYAKKDNQAAKCLLAYAHLTGKGFPKDPNKAMDILNKLSDTNHYPLAQWLIARAYLNGIGVEENLDLSLRRAFQAARNNFPNALVYMSSLFSPAPEVTQGTEIFPEKIKPLQETIDLLTSRHSTFEKLDEYTDISDFKDSLSQVLSTLKHIKPGLMMNWMKMDTDFIAKVRKLENSKFIYFYNECLSWGEENVTLTRNIELFYQEIDSLFEKADKALVNIRELLKRKITTLSEVPKVEPQKEKEPFQKKQVVSSLKKVVPVNPKELIDSCNRKIKRLEEDRETLIQLKQQMMDLNSTIQGCTNVSFLKKYPFFKPLKE